MDTDKEATRLDLRNDPVLRWLRAGVIGRDATLPTSAGPRRKRYFDQTSSGLPFAPIEELIRDRVLPMMTNTHTEANTCSRYMTQRYEEAHLKARRALRAAPDDVVIFTGSGATGAINKLIGVLGLRIPDNIARQQGCGKHWDETGRPLVIRSRMEHHSNDLPWRETIADTEYVGYDSLGRPDWRDLERILRSPRYKGRELKIGTFSAASNVTGIVSDVDALARVMHEHGGCACFDYAAAAPYVDLDLHPGDDPARRRDAIFVSMHKFVGGPQTPGLLAANRALFRNTVPVEPGGGTVLYTSPWEYRYLDDLQHREEGGTPPIVQVIRAGLVFDLKEAVGVGRIHAVEQHFLMRAIRAWRDEDAIRILGDLAAPRIGILSLMLDNGALHYNLAVRLLNDLYGIQTRGGCMCAGTYGHDLLGIDQATSREIRERLDGGDLGAKPGWVRVGFSPATSEGEFRVLLEAVPHIARHWRRYADRYAFDPDTAAWRAREGEPELPALRLVPDLPA
ncbi:MAG: aminotransferase class V-fold PLP-dependent enzyme [Pseudomonadota bacterium]